MLSNLLLKANIWQELKHLWITLIVVSSIIALVLLISLIMFMLVCYVKTRKPYGANEFPIPRGKAYEPFAEKMKEGIRLFRKLEAEEFSVRTDDGLILRGKYFEFFPNGTIEIMFPGYRGSAERDLSGGVIRARLAGHNVLVVDNRASGNSQGHIITFGIKEHKDCLKWIDLVIKEKGENVKIILSGISMGASTVLMASGYDLPKNVIGIIADCGYTAPSKIIKTVIKKIHLPEWLIYPFIWLGARVFGGFDLNSISPEEMVAKSTLPTIFFHGEADAFVPMYMSVENYEKCSGPKKKLVTIKGAAHGLAFMLAEEEYVNEVKNFFNE